MSDYLPNEIVCDILKRLPAKFVGRCTTVCKSWYSLITNPNFISFHLKHTPLCNRNDAHTLILKHLDPNVKSKNFITNKKDGTSYKLTYLGFPFKIPFGFTRIVGSCMGLVCLTNDDLKTIILWNPSIKKFDEIGLTKKSELPHLFVLGFGICPVTFDPKIVKIEYSNEYTKEVSVPPQVQIYALSSGNWKSVPCDLPPYSMIEILWSQVFLNGAIHWVASDKRGEGTNRSLVMSFDLVNAAFREIELPKDIADEHSSNLFLAIFEESLCVLRYTKVKNWCYTWFMKEYGVSDSWTRLSCFNPSNSKLGGFGEDGDGLLLWDDEMLVLYNSGMGEIKERDPDCSIGSLYADTFMENLLLLNGHSCVREEEKQIEG